MMLTMFERRIVYCPDSIEQYRLLYTVHSILSNTVHVMHRRRLRSSALRLML